MSKNLIPGENEAHFPTMKTHNIKDCNIMRFFMILKTF